MKEEIQKLVEEIKAQGYENICIWAPALNIGGGTILYTKLARFLVRNTDLNVYYMDYNDSFAQFLLKDTPEVNFLKYSEADLFFPLKEKCIILVNTTRVVQLKNMNPENKILFWHYETVKCGWEIVLIDDKTNKFLNLAKRNKAIIYHDWSGRDSLRRYQKINLTNKDYFYIAVEEKQKECCKNIINKDELNICFLSRLAPDKKESLYYLIENYARYKTTKKKRLHVIGDGRSRDEVHNFCKKYEKDIEFIFTGTIPKDNLDDYLIKNTDVLFAVGTCVLEGAALKLPSVVLLMSGKTIKDDEAYWLQDTIEYCVGITTEEKKDFKVKYTKINQILDSVYNNNGKETKGNESYNYYIANHSKYEKLVADICRFLKNTTLTFKKLKKCIKYAPYNNLKTTYYNIFGFRFMKKNEFLDKIEYFIGNIKVCKIKIHNNNAKIRFLGIPITKESTKTVYKFPATLHKDNYEAK